MNIAIYAWDINSLTGLPKKKNPKHNNYGDHLPPNKGVNRIHAIDEQLNI